MEDDAGATGDARERVVRDGDRHLRGLGDTAVQAEWDRAEAMKTDYEKREVLKSYYRLLYGRMAKIDPSLKTLIDAQLQQSLGRLAQTKVAPTQPPANVAAGPRAGR